MAAVAPILALTVRLLVDALHEPSRGIRVGVSQAESSAGMRPATMSSHVLSLLIVGLFFQLLPQALSVHASVIPQSISIATTNATLRGHSAYCSDNGGWVGDGIRKSDCADAISEFTRTEVDPRGEQKFEFRSRGVHKTSVLPTVTTPRKYDYGG